MVLRGILLKQAHLLRMRCLYATGRQRAGLVTNPGIFAIQRKSYTDSAWGSPGSLHENQRCHMVDPEFEPIYLKTAREGLLDAKLEAAEKELRNCKACPRACGVDRIEHADGRHAVCGVGSLARVSAAFPHFGEEPCLQGTFGSGTIFFGGCNLKCVFCQNWDISQTKNGWALTADEIADLMLKLQDETRCHNINFVTPEHVAPHVVQAIAKAVPRGLRVPIVYNTSSYDSMESLRLMDGLVDIYMPDFKFWDPATARRLAKAEDYVAVAKETIREMHRQVGVLKFGQDGLAKRGVLVRHLIMPGMADQGAEIMRWLAQELGRDTYINLMEQYRPEHLVGRERRVRSDAQGAGPGSNTSVRHTEINRRITQDELQYVEGIARASGLWRFAHEC